MKQIIQNLKTGKTDLEELPAPQVKPGWVLIQTSRSLVSLGTERMLVEFGKANLIDKARQQPDKSERLRSQDKGQKACVAAFVGAIRSGEPAPIPFEEIMEVARVSIEVAESLRS